MPSANGQGSSFPSAKVGLVVLAVVLIGGWFIFALGMELGLGFTGDSQVEDAVERAGYEDANVIERTRVWGFMDDDVCPGEFDTHRFTVEATVPGGGTVTLFVCRSSVHFARFELITAPTDWVDDPGVQPEGPHDEASS